ncbi:MAG: holo-ACP synthase [Chloroflexi bacterium]|nr:holo-ACP synthase [Chloroflexota bacterium]
MTRARISPSARPRLWAGVDMVQVGEARELLERYGERFLRKCFGSEEIAFCLAQRDPAPHLAARLAVKEAFIKAVRGRCPTALHEIQTVKDARGAPGIRLVGSVARASKRLPQRRFHVSMSHAGDYAIAHVIGVA